MDARRRNLWLASALFGAWLATLASLAFLSGRRPTVKPSAEVRAPG